MVGIRRRSKRLGRRRSTVRDDVKPSLTKYEDTRPFDSLPSTKIGALWFIEVLEMTGLRERAIEILRRNDRGGYSVPTDGLYPFQWNWDAGFAAMGYACFDEARAWEELRSMLRGQWDDGMVPHIVFHTQDPRYFPGPELWGVEHMPETSGITQPPILAVAVRHVWRRARDRAAADAAGRELFPKLLAWHRWYHTARDPDGGGLVSTYHPWETGMDNSPAWDRPLGRTPVDDLPPYERRDTSHVDASQRPRQAEYDRYLTLVHRFRARGYQPKALYAESPFRVADLAVNSILLRADRELLLLAADLGIEAGRAELEAWIDRASAGLERLWSEKAGGYRSLDLLNGEALEVGTSAGFLPLFAGGLPDVRARRLIEMLEAWGERVRYLVPSTDPAAAQFEPRRYWRGPVWLVVNWMIAEGLAAHGARNLALRLREHGLELVETNGFFEYFDPRDGEGCGGGAFTWTAAVALFWLLDGA
jgi:glycogen debranching enzyme